jgi:hypothetical protein
MPKGSAAKKITSLICQLGHFWQSTTFGMWEWGTR